ncbi:MAG: IS1595 family transposase [Actinomycetota bacterium]|nr:IS1595 family transposase [Actinomycetota bacterium]
MDAPNILTLSEQLRTEADAYKFLEDLRWGDTPVCPHCGSAEKMYFLTPTNGSTRPTRTGSASQRRVWKCAACRKQFSVLTGTIFHGTKIPVRTWIFVVFEMCASKNGVAAREIQRKYGLTGKSAWHMLHRVRFAMERDPMAGLLSGRVVADETWVGGKMRNRHGGTNPRKTSLDPKQRFADKTAVVSLVSRETGEVRSRVVPEVSGDNLRAVLDEHVDQPATHLHTDAGTHYRKIVGNFAEHSFVSHVQGEYVRGDVSTNQAENYFSQLKRSIDGTHHRVSREHLDRYLAEFDYRYSTRGLSDSERMAMFGRQVGGRRLTYRQAT